MHSMVFKSVPQVTDYHWREMPKHASGPITIGDPVCTWKWRVIEFDHVRVIQPFLMHAILERLELQGSRDGKR